MNFARIKDYFQMPFEKIKAPFDNLSKRSFLVLAATVMLLGTLVVTVFLAKESQNLRSRAYDVVTTPGTYGYGGYNTSLYNTSLEETITPAPTNIPTATPAAQLTVTIAPTTTPGQTATSVPTATPTPAPINYMQNNSFESGTTSWAFAKKSPAAGSFTTTTSTAESGASSAQLTITSISSSIFGIQLNSQSKLPMTAGHTYQVSFWAKSSKNRQIETVIQQWGSPYATYVKNDQNLTTSWQQYTFRYVAPTTQSYVALRIRLGQAASTIWLDNVSYTDVSTSTTAGNGLTGSYFTNTTLNSTTGIVRIDPTVNFNWGSGSPATGIPVDKFSVRWEGHVRPLYSQVYTFYTQTDDGVRLWANGIELINDWTRHSSKENKGTIALTAGEKYKITMEYFEYAGSAVAQLKWSSTSQPKQIIPQGDLFSS